MRNKYRNAKERGGGWDWDGFRTKIASFFKINILTFYGVHTDSKVILHFF
jgi:hypothetical protein